VVRDYFTALIALVIIGAAAERTGVASRSQTPGNLSPTGNQSGVNQTSAQPADPAAVMFATETGIVLHAVKPASVPDYEAAIVALQDAFSKSSDEKAKRVASGWRVWKAAEPDAKANIIYVHTLLPASPEVDYRPSRWLDDLMGGAPSDLLAKYRDSFALPPSKLSLTELSNMAIAPAVPLNVSPAAPANATPAKAGNGSPP
jgi:hypothetical protein